MKNTDLLFISQKDSPYAHICDEYLNDMAFDCISEILTNNEYSAFTKVISKPLVNTNNILERQKIFQDFLSYQGLAENMISICLAAQQNKFPVYDRVYSSIPSKRKLVDYLRIINRTLKIPSELFDVMKDIEFKSTTLKNMCEQLDKNNELATIKLKINNFAANFLSDNISLQIKYGTTFKFKSANVYSNGKKAVLPSKHKFFQKKQKIKGYSYGYDFIADLQVGNMLESGIVRLCSIISQLNSHILSYCEKLLDHLSFFVSGIKIIKYLNNKGFKIVFPKFTESKNSILATGLFDIGLAIKCESFEEIISNNFFGESASFYLISGANQGGKTTFLKSIGIAQLFAQNGLPIVADEYICPVFNNFITHFPRDEDKNLDKGKLAEELSRFHDLLPFMVNNALILMNESFATTTEREGAEIAVDVLKALSLVNPFLLFVTHNYVLLKNRNELSVKFENNISLRSLVVKKGNSPMERTYKLEEDEPQEEINTIEFLKNFIK